MAWADFWEMLHAVCEDENRKAGKIKKKTYTPEQAERVRLRLTNLAKKYGPQKAGG